MLKTKLSNQELILGSWLSIPSTAIAEVLSNTALDFLVIDLEHSCISLRECEEMIRVIDLKGKSPLVRLSSIDGIQAKRVMDAGAHGVIVPMVKTVEEARHIVGSVHFTPHGFRGVGLARAQRYGLDFENYFHNKSKSTVVIVQIEHIDSVQNFENIMNVEGVDGFIIGPYDLSASMGIPGQFEHPEFLKVLNKVNEMSKKNGYISGTHLVEPNQNELLKKIELGYKFIAYGVDFKLIQSTIQTGLDAVKRRD